MDDEAGRAGPAGRPLDQAPPRSAPTPVEHSSRVATLDVLRGFALLGILAVNVESFSGPESMHDIPVGMVRPAFVGWHAHLDIAILVIKWAFVEGKMRAMFGMLFGAGVVLLTDRIEQRAGAGEVADIYVRRNMWLGLFGLIHGTLIWEGDILLQYALCALLFLYPFRRLAARKLIGIGMAIWIIGGTYGVLNFFDASRVIAQAQVLASAQMVQRVGATLTPAQHAALANELAISRAKPAAIAAAAQAGRRDYLDSLADRADSDVSFVYHVFRCGWIAEVVGCMLVGMGLFRCGFLSGRLSSRTYVLTAVIGYAVAWPTVIIGIWQTKLAGFSDAAAMRWMWAPYDVEQAAGTLANAAIVILIIKSGSLRTLTGALQSVGRTALSNYIATSVFCQVLFCWGPLKLFGTLQYYQELYVVLAFWSLSLVTSSVWLQHFTYGPLEWLWRSLTYAKRQPFKIIV